MAEPGVGEGHTQEVDFNKIEPGTAINGHFLSMNGGIIEATRGRDGGMVARPGDHVTARRQYPSGTWGEVTGIISELWHDPEGNGEINCTIIPTEGPDRRENPFFRFNDITHNVTEQHRLDAIYGRGQIPPEHEVRYFVPQHSASNPPERATASQPAA